MIGWITRRVHARRSADDDGMGIVFVLMITSLLMIMVGTASAALVAQMKPATDTVYSGSAVAAAEAGISDAVGWLNTNCGSPDGLECNGVTPTVGYAATKKIGANDHERFTWKILTYVSGKMRISSKGEALAPPDGTGAQRLLESTTLVADIVATPSFTNFQYYTKFETFPADFVNYFYSARNIQITDATNSALSGPGTLSWNGTCSYDATTNPTCDQNHDTNICEDLYYPSTDGDGRSTDAAWYNALRRPDATTQAAMGTDRNFAYYSEPGTFTPTSSPNTHTPEVHNDTCDSTFEPNMVMNGPIYSQDAYLIDRGYDTGHSQNSMPVFSDPAYTMWDGTANGAQAATGPNGGYIRAYPGTDGAIYTSVSPQPVYTTDKLELPANADDARGLATCTYTGPTRILLKQDIAEITSPQTPTSPAPAGPDYCYRSTGDFTNANGTTGGGVVDAKVPIGSTLIYVANPSTTDHPVATKSAPIFDLTTNVTVPPPSSGDSLAGAWADTASYSAGMPCPTPADPTEERNFDCETSAASPAADVFAAIRTAVDAEVASSDADGVIKQNLTRSIEAAMGKAVFVTSQPDSLNAGDVRYQVTIGDPVAGTATTVKPSTQSDDFFQSSPGQGYTATPESWAISIKRYACTARSGSCAQNKQDVSSMLKTTSTATRTTYAANSPLNSTATWPWFGAQTGDHTYTDPNTDITRYYDNYGDAYVQGTLKGRMTIVAEHDIVATNNLTYSNTNLNTTSDGLALVADHDVRIYRPMRCTDDGTAGATSPGYCPNDLTGVYTQRLQWPLPANYPSLKYVADAAPSATSTGAGVIYATIFTLRGCFMIDNFYRGQIGAGATVYGGLYQYHRGPTSLPYQGRPYQGSTTKMPGVTLTYNYDNMRAQQNLSEGLRVPWVPTPQGQPTSSPQTWNTVAISTGS